MEFRAYKSSDSPAIEGLVFSVFSESEGEQEGVLIRNLAREMMATTDSQDLYGFVAVDGEQTVGAIFFSRLTFETDINVFILAPVAVHTDHQGKGIGQSLVRYGLEELRKQRVTYVTTYGDPVFYSKVGFSPISPTMIEPPFMLTQPEGWLGKSLTDRPMEKIPGHCTCVGALHNPAYW